MQQARLSAVPFFSAVAKKDLAVVAQQTDEVDVPAGEVLAREGDLGDAFYVIEDGTAEVTMGGSRVAELGPGDFFGEMALLEDADRRNATVTASSPMKLIVMTRSSFRTVNRTLPQVHDAVCRAIAERHAAMTTQK